MAIQYMENFQYYNSLTANLIAGTPWANIYSGSGIVDDPDPNADTDSKALTCFMSPTGASVNRLAIPNSGQQMGIACRWWMSSLPESTVHGGGFQFNTAGNLPMYLVNVLPTGALQLVRRDKSGWTTAGDVVVDTTSGPVVTGGAWYHWEFYIDTATGDYEVRVEGIPVLDGNDASHHSDVIGIIAFVEHWETTASDSETRYVKDIVVWDDTGTVNNSFIGPVTIYCLQVDGDVSDTNATPSTGTTVWQTMDELNVSDVDYTTLGAVVADAIMTLEDVPSDVVAIRALQTVVRAQKTDGGDATMQVGLISDGSEDTGSDDAVNTSFRYHFDVSELDPDTAAAWTPISVNAATIKINRTL
jgi:hypothetical protein